jgi:transcription elongation GreA/GreB family factor
MSMSRAFVRESDQEPESLPDRPISSHPNFVTQSGLEQIAARIRELESQRQAELSVENSATLAGIDRDLRYWRKRRATARVIEPAVPLSSVVFGAHVTLHFADGAERGFRLVGEDEADPARSLLSWVSPLARALIGQRAGDVVRFQDKDVEILRIEP